MIIMVLLFNVFCLVLLLYLRSCGYQQQQFAMDFVPYVCVHKVSYHSQQEEFAFRVIVYLCIKDMFDFLI